MLGASRDFGFPGYKYPGRRPNSVDADPYPGLARFWLSRLQASGAPAE